MTIALVSSTRLYGTVSRSFDAGEANIPIDLRTTTDISHGTGLNQANTYYEDDFSIALSGSLSIDLASSLVDVLGNTVIFAAVKEILIIADLTNTNSIIIGNGTNPFLAGFGAAAHTFTLVPGGTFHVKNYSAAGWAVGAGVSDVLKLTNSAAGTAVTGSIAIVGEV